MFTRMGKQIGVGVIVLVMLVEVGILISSYESRKGQLNKLKITLEMDVKKKSGGDFHEMHPDILSDDHISLLMKDFLKNVLLLSLAIGVITALGTMYVFHFYVGRHILRLKRLNSMNRGKKVARWRDDQVIPANEVGELILEREDLLTRIEAQSS